MTKKYEIQLEISDGKSSWIEDYDVTIDQLMIAYGEQLVDHFNRTRMIDPETHTYYEDKRELIGANFVGTVEQ